MRCSQTWRKIWRTRPWRVQGPEQLQGSSRQELRSGFFRAPWPGWISARHCQSMIPCHDSNSNSRESTSAWQHTLTIPPKSKPVGKGVTLQKKLGDGTKREKGWVRPNPCPHGAYNLIEALAWKLMEENQKSQRRKWQGPESSWQEKAHIAGRWVSLVKAYWREALKNDNRRCTEQVNQAPSKGARAGKCEWSEETVRLKFWTREGWEGRV